jgi:hypothetical protein
LRALLGIAAIALVLAACTSGDSDNAASQTPVDRPQEGNLFLNPGFEGGGDPWFSIDTWLTHFQVSDAFAHSGTHSALLKMDSTQPGDNPSRVHGVVQEPVPDQFPEVVSGYYYVDKWERGLPKQYLQFVVIAADSDNLPSNVGATNHQIRYVLAGVTEPPLSITNARYIFLGGPEPEQWRWVYFERNIRKDFQEQWGAVPEGYSKLRILFEARWDERDLNDTASLADVYYDDLYIGPQ